MLWVGYFADVIVQQIFELFLLHSLGEGFKFANIHVKLLSLHKRVGNGLILFLFIAGIYTDSVEVFGGVGVDHSCVLDYSFKFQILPLN